MLISQFVDKLKYIANNQNMRAVVQDTLKEEVNDLKKMLQMYSPYDTGKFSGNWKVHTDRFVAGYSVGQLTIENDRPYAFFLEMGADKNAAPWYYPHRYRRGKKKGQFKKGTGKLKVSNNKVWAGGLNPGHDMTVGGVIANVMKESAFATKIGKRVHDSYLQVLV